MAKFYQSSLKRNLLMELIAGKNVRGGLEFAREKVETDRVRLGQTLVNDEDMGEMLGGDYMTIFTSTDPTTVPPAIKVDDQEHQERGRNHNVHLVNSEHNSTDTNTGEKSHSRRSSITTLVDRLRSRSRSRPRQSIDDVLEEDQDKEYVYSRRKSSDMRGEYASALRAQTEYMERLREEQARNGITHNVDGIRIPPPVNPPEGRRRSIIAAFSRGSSRSRSREPSLDRIGSRNSSRSRATGDSSTLTVEGDNDREYKYSRRKSSEISGPYAATLQSQLEYMENLREEQARNGITHNADGIKIPDPVNPNAGRRSSVITGTSALNKMQI
ncbi:hypothetical protein EDD11_007932 [Mortierella claussenii]|nr:hypothetical protein EDD11_007932 [Mortierella claussenii]